MRQSKFNESQIVGILKEAESGVPVADLQRQHGISKTTFFKWRSKYAGASVADVKRLRELEGENAKLKRMYADLALENAAARRYWNRIPPPGAPAGGGGRPGGPRPVAAGTGLAADRPGGPFSLGIERLSHPQDG